LLRNKTMVTEFEFEFDCGFHNEGMEPLLMTNGPHPNCPKCFVEMYGECTKPKLIRQQAYDISLEDLKKIESKLFWNNLED